MEPSREIPIDSVSPHPRNVREGDIGAISESLKTFGQYRPVVVQAATPEGEERNYVLAGNHTWRAAKALGWKSISAVMLTVDDGTAVRIMVADNRTHDLGADREGDLAELLSDLASLDLLAGTGFDGDDLDRMLSQNDWKEGIEFQDAVTKDEVGPSDAGCTIGSYRWVVTRDEYDRWVSEIIATTGNNREQIILEMRRRLGL